MHQPKLDHVSYLQHKGRGTGVLQCVYLHKYGERCIDAACSAVAVSDNSECNDVEVSDNLEYSDVAVSGNSECSGAAVSKFSTVLHITKQNRANLTTRIIKALSCKSNFDRVPGEIKRSRDLRGGRWSWTLTFAQKRSWVGRWSWAEQVGRLLLRVVQVVRQQPCNGHCLSDSVQHSSWKSNCAVHKSLGNGEGTPP